MYFYSIVERGLQNKYTIIYMQLHFLGELYNVNIFATTIISYNLTFNYSEFILTTPKSGVKQAKVNEVVEDWYRKQAKKYLINEVNIYCEKLGVKYNKLVIKNTKTRWGSCSSKGNLNFNYNLIKMPKEILEYVVIHEVCHLKHLNHSKEYWQLVKSLCVDYKERIRWVKENGLGFIS